MNEEKWIESITRRLDRHPALLSGLDVGPGDDAAILSPCAEPLAVTTDLLSDGVDFLVGKTDPVLIGRKAIAVNLSDLAAMAARPVSVVVSVLLPKQAPSTREGDLANGLVQGMLPILEEYQTSLAGGDTNSWEGKLAISVAAFGRTSPKRSFLRSGAREGDHILVSGALGGSIYGRQYRFLPRIPEALFLRKFADIHAAMDISDGLLLDLTRLARASKKSFQIREESIPIHSDVFQFLDQEIPGARLGISPLEHALGDGEDFELILTASPKEARRLTEEQPFLSSEFRAFCLQEGYPIAKEPPRLTDIGLILPEGQASLRIAPDGRAIPINSVCGWEHQF